MSLSPAMITSSEPASPVPAPTIPDAHPDTCLQEGQYESTVPVIMDRCHQARVRNALEPEWEARFEPRSYGFRPGRGCHDAIATLRVSHAGLAVGEGDERLAGAVRRDDGGIGAAG